MQDSNVSRTVSWTNLVNLLCLSVLSLANGSYTSEGSPGKQNQYFIHKTHTHTPFPGGTTGKEPTCQCRREVRDAGSIPGSERYPAGRSGNPL